MSGKGKVKPNNQVAPGPIGNTQGLIVPQTSPNASGPGNSAPPPKPTPKEEGWWKRWGSDALHTTLDVVGMIPGVGEVADGANALVYLAEGDKVSAALSAAAMLPVGGQAATAGKWGRKGVQAVEQRVAKEAAERTAKEAAEKAAKERLEREAAERAKKEAEARAAGSGGMIKKKKSLREQYMGKTPGKNSRTGKEVQKRMREEGTLRDGPDGVEFKSSDGEWYPISYADMSHKTDAVKWWNEKGREYGAKSRKVRDWMLESKNYTLEHYSTNRSAGGRLPDRYQTPFQ